MKEKITKVVKEQFGKEPESVEKEAEGLLQKTFTAKVDGEECIVQFSGDDYEDHDSLGHCLKMYELLSGSEVPVPEAVTEVPVNLEDEEYIIVKKLEGENMEQNISPQKVSKSAKILADIHDLYRSEHEGHIEFKEKEMKVHQFEEGSLKENKRNEMLEKIEVFRNNDLEDLADKLEEYLSENIDEAYPEEFEAVLCHDDFSPDNTIWKNGEITGIIDFDYAFSGIPERNLVKAANAFWMHDPGADWKIRETFYEAYKEEREVADNFNKIEKYFRIETLTIMVAGLIELEEVNKEQKEFYKEKLFNQL